MMIFGWSALEATKQPSTISTWSGDWFAESGLMDGSKAVKGILGDCMRSGRSNPINHSKDECYANLAAKGRGAKVWDAAYKEYLDFCLADGSLILGHQGGDFFEIIENQASLASHQGPRAELEANFSRMIQDAFPSMERTHFMESKDMARSYALEQARSQTGHKDVIKVVRDPSASINEPETRTILVPINDLDDLTVALEKNEVAAIILEPVLCFPGPIAPEEDYLHQLREIADVNGIVLVFDESNTGLRLAMGGAQEYYRVRPDMTILGRIAGGGFPIGVCGASIELMGMKASNGGKLAMPSDPYPLAAGMETVRRLRVEGHDRLNAMGERMGKGLEAVLNEFHVRYKASAVGSMFQVFLDPAGPEGNGRRSFEQNLYQKVWGIAHENGVLFSPSQRGTNFISTAHTEEDIDEAVNAVLVSLGEAAL